MSLKDLLEKSKKEKEKGTQKQLKYCTWNCYRNRNRILLGILFAPKSRKETREQLRYQRYLSQKLKPVVDEAKETI